MLSFCRSRSDSLGPRTPVSPTPRRRRRNGARARGRRSRQTHRYHRTYPRAASAAALARSSVLERSCLKWAISRNMSR